MKSRDTFASLACRKQESIVDQKSIPIAVLKSSFRRSVVPSIYDHPIYRHGYSAAVAKLHAVIAAYQATPSLSRSAPGSCSGGEP